jgi:hypothetical protein
MTSLRYRAGAAADVLRVNSPTVPLDERYATVFAAAGHEERLFHACRVATCFGRFN